MIFIVGLGNFDAKYSHTYHNVGFDVVDALAEKLNFKFNKQKFKADIAEGYYNGEKLVLVKPRTFMNLSGESVVLLKKHNKEARIIVVVDDIDLPRGTIRYRERGSSGTHNGIRNIVSYIGEDFERVKVGIGRDIFMDLADYVLSKYDIETFSPIISKAAEEVLNRLK